LVDMDFWRFHYRTEEQGGSSNLVLYRKEMIAVIIKMIHLAALSRFTNSPKMARSYSASKKLDLRWSRGY